jgi:predicted GNAT superfamily acetyltransferase
VETGEIRDPSAEIVYRLCHQHDEFRACMEIERRVWGDPGLSVPLTLYVVAAENGGQVIGAFSGTRMIGFTYALPGYRDGRVYLCSHMTAVLPEFRDQGVGRGLKLFQRQEALARGLRRVEWTFDPLEIKNAYFNLVRLGAIARRYIPNCYGLTTSPLHARLPTDRLVAEWELVSSRVEACLRGHPPRVGSQAVRIAVPLAQALARFRDPETGLALQARLRQEFQQWFERGYVAVSLEVSGHTAFYVLVPGNEPGLEPQQR